MKNELKRIIGIFLALLLAASLMPAQKGFATGKSKEDGQQSSGQADLPARYDPRELGLVTPVKSQGDYGTCGTFALAAVMEHNAMLRGYGEYDLSEYQLAWALLHPLELEGDLAAGEGPEHNDTNSAWHYGVYGGILSSTLLRGYGLRTEEEYPYEEMEKDLPKEAISYGGCLYPDSCYTVPATDAAAIKTLITTNGSVYLNVCARSWSDELYGNPDTHAAYLPRFGKPYYGIDHFITVVGWDDAYSKDNFATTPPEDGAWIIKNSWGEEVFGEDGYAYLSYCDATFNKNNCAVSVTVSPERGYDRIYQYDGGVGLRAVKKVTDAVINFTAAKDEAITGVRIKPLGALESNQFYCSNWAFEETTAVIAVYEGPFDVENPDEREALYTQEYRILYPDYQTVHLEQEVELTKGQEYHVRVSFKDPIYYAVDSPYQTLFYSYQNMVSAQPGETYLCTLGDGGNPKWEDPATMFGKQRPSSACLKVLVRDGEDSEAEQGQTDPGEQTDLSGFMTLIENFLKAILAALSAMFAR